MTTTTKIGIFCVLVNVTILAIENKEVLSNVYSKVKNLKKK